VIISTKIAVKDVIDTEEIKGDMNIAVNLASRMIKSWNFKDDEGNNLPVDKKYVEQLPTDDLEFVLDAIKPYIKKKQNLDKTT